MPTLERKTGRKVTKLSTRAPAQAGRPAGELAAGPKRPAAAADSAIPSPEQLLAESATQLRAVQAAIQQALEGGTATPALARESASVSRAIAILSKELRDREKATRDRYARLSDRERHELAIDLVCSLPRAARTEAHKRLAATLGKKGRAE